MGQKEKAILLTITLLGLGLRLWGIGFGLPYLYHPDEHKIVSTALGFGTGDFNPHFFNYPTFYIYFQFLLYGIWYGLGLLFGLFSSPYHFAYQYIADPTAIHTIGRAATAFFGAGMIPLVFLLARRISDSKTALIAATFTGSSFLLIQDSHFITTDIPMTFFILLSTLFAFDYAQTGRMNRLLLAALFCGIAASTKYNGVLSAVTVCSAVLISQTSQSISQRVKHLVLSSIVILIGFLGFSPFIVFDFSAFKRGIIFEYRHAHFGHLGFFGTENGWWFHIKSSLAQGVGWPIVLLGMVSLIIVLIRPRKKQWLLSLFPAAYFLFIGTSNTLFHRYAIPLIPFLAVFAAISLAFIAEKIKAGQRLFLFICIALCITPNLTRAVYHDLLLTRTDTRTLAARWIEKKIPPGKVILVDSYGPQLTDSKPQAMGTPVGRDVKEKIKQEVAATRTSYRVTNLSLEGKFDPEWIKFQKPDYLVLSSYITDRLKERSKKRGNPNPFIDWINGDLPVAQRFSPYKKDADRPDSFNLKSLMSPAVGDLFIRNLPGPVVTIYGPLSIGAEKEPQPKDF